MFSRDFRTRNHKDIASWSLQVFDIFDLLKSWQIRYISDSMDFGAEIVFAHGYKKLIFSGLKRLIENRLHIDLWICLKFLKKQFEDYIMKIAIYFWNRLLPTEYRVIRADFELKSKACSVRNTQLSSKYLKTAKDWGKM